MAGFSRDAKDPPARFRPGPGQIGVAAALHGQRAPNPAGGGGKTGSGVRSPGASGSRQGGRVSSLGLPEPPPQEPSDGRHLQLGLMHHNASGLGRDLPFGLWALHNGYASEIMPPGTEPFDWFEHA